MVLNNHSVPIPLVLFCHLLGKGKERKANRGEEKNRERGANASSSFLLVHHREKRDRSQGYDMNTFQFVEMRKFLPPHRQLTAQEIHEAKRILAKEVLQEIPGQLTSYMKSKVNIYEFDPFFFT